MSRFYIPESDNEYLKYQEQRRIANQARKQKQEESELPKQVVKTAVSTAPMVFKGMEAIDKIETAKLLDADVMSMTDSAGNPVFVQNVATDDGVVTNTINNSTTKWTGKVKLNPKTTMSEAEVQTVLIDKGINASDAAAITSSAPPTSTMGEFSKGVETGLQPGNFTQSSEAVGLTTDASKLGNVAGKVGTGIAVASGVHRAFTEEDTHEKIHGAIQAATPWLMAAGPIGWAVAGINLVWDMLD